MRAKKFKEFLRMSDFFNKTVGIETYERHNAKRKSILVDAIFLVGIINLNANALGELIYAFLAARSGNIFESIQATSYLGFVAVADTKMLCIWWRKTELNSFMNQLNRMFPQSIEQQEQYEVTRYLRKCTFVTIAFSLLYMLLIWTYNLMGMVQYLIFNKWYQMSDYDMRMPYLISIPWEWQGHWTYYPLYVSQAMAGYTSAASQIGSDLLLCAAATQLLMHYDYVARTLEEYRAQGKADMEFLAELVKHHEQILSLSDIMNDVFGIPLLFNFMASSFVVCFVGFQMTIGVSADSLFKLLLFLLSSLAQVYLICYYGQQLQIASENVSAAVYNHDWHQANVRYKKMLILVTKRAQKPASLKATSFVKISLGTMTDLMQLSYKFFALLRTMYAK